jgi:hypothetical protein
MPGHYKRGAFASESLGPRQILALRRAFSWLGHCIVPGSFGRA